MTEIYDVAIVGAGAGGMTTAIYASRAGLKVALIERGLYGGQLHNTDVVDNYTGFTSVQATTLASSMEAHVDAQNNIEKIYADIKEVHKKDNTFSLVTRKDTIESKSVVIGTGVKHKKLNIPGEDEYDGRGISYCAVCDGNFFMGKHVAVVGGGDSAVESAIYLANIVDKVTLIHRRRELRADKILQDRLFSLPNVEVIWNAKPCKFIGDDAKVRHIQLVDSDTGLMKGINIDGVFVYIGMLPVSKPFENLGIVDEEGFIVTDSRMATSESGVCAIGDVRSDSIRQVVSATGDGAMASESVVKYLQERNL